MIILSTSDSCFVNNKIALLLIFISFAFNGLRVLGYEVAGGWVRPVGPRASTDGAFALRWQIDGDNQISDGESDYGSAVFSADGDRHRSLLSARDAPPLSRLDRDWQRRGFLRLDRRIRL